MKLLEPIQVGGITLKNRIMFPPLTTGYEDRTGAITDRSCAFYTRLAQGGAGYSVLGDVSPVPSFSQTPRLYEDAQIPGFRALADALHVYGAKVGVQIFHPEYDVQALLSLFAKRDMEGVRAKMHHDMQHYITEVSPEQLADIIEKMCACARRAQEAGIDFVQVHGDRLVGCLCSPLMNRRTDEFGGSFENRTRFARMLVRALRRAVPGMGLDYKFAVVTPQRGKGGIPQEEAVAFARQLEEDGVDMLHVAQANHTGNMADTIPPMGVQPYGFFVDIASEVKKNVSIPVSTVGRIVDAAMAERVLEAGKADIIALGRPLLCDPDWGVKLAGNRAQDIRRCISCNKGCTDNIQNRAFLACVLNPENGHELERRILPAQVKKKVAIVGGGPAGLEAARVAALRGHTVTLYERADVLGGQLNLAAVPPRKGEMRRALQDMARAARAAGARLCLGQEVTAEMLMTDKPDAVIVATGAQSFAPAIPGRDGVNVADAWDVLAGRREVYGRVAVIGGGLVGCETAEYLARQGCQVSVVEMLDKIADGESGTVLPTLLESFRACGMQQLPGHKVEQIRLDAVVCTDKEGNTVELPCDHVVLALGARPVAFDTKALEEAGVRVVRVGDCAGRAADLDNATKTAYDAACTL